MMPYYELRNCAFFHKFNNLKQNSSSVMQLLNFIWRKTTVSDKHNALKISEIRHFLCDNAIFRK